MRTLFAVVLFIFIGLATPTVGVAGAPWTEGDRIDGWTLREITSHPVYVRLHFERAGEETSVEVLEDHDGSGPWATDTFRIQPSPGHSPPESLLRAVLDTVAATEAGGSEVAVLAGAGGAPTRRPPCPWGLAFLGLIACFALSVAGRYLWSRRQATSDGSEPPDLRGLVRTHLMAFVLSIPAFLLALVILDVVIWVVDLRSVDAETLRGFIQQHHDPLQVQEEASFSITATEDRLSWSNSGDFPGGSLELSGVDHLIMTFGGSSLVISDDTDPGINFSSLLEGRLGEHQSGDWKVANLGVPGLNSTAVLHRIRRSLDQVTPALVLVYSGHNDNMIYRHFADRNLLLAGRRPYLTGMIQLAWTLDFWATVNLTWRPGYPVDAEARLLRLLQRVGVVDLSTLPFDEFRSHVLETFEAYPGGGVLEVH